MTYSPLHDFIFAKRLTTTTDRTASGLYIPDAAKETPQLAEVFGVGPGRVVNGVRLPMAVKVGDTILFGKWSGVEIPDGDQKYLILSEQEVLGVIE